MKIEGLSYDWSKIIGRSRKVSRQARGGIEFLFKKNKIDYLRGTGSIPRRGQGGSHRQADGKNETHDARENPHRHRLRKPRAMPGLPFNGKTVIGSQEAMILPTQPKGIIIIGAGAIGIEFAYFFNAYGTKVTVIEMLPDILPVEDTEVSALLEKSLKKTGIRMPHHHQGHRQPRTRRQGVEITVEGAAQRNRSRPRSASSPSASKPVLPGGIELKLTERGWHRTPTPATKPASKDIYAAGDIIGPPWLAHVASYEAVQCVEGLFDQATSRRKSTLFPGCTYCQPQVASIGLTERAAKEKGLKFKVGKFPYQASGKALAVGETEGFVKLIYRRAARRNHRRPHHRHRSHRTDRRDRPRHERSKPPRTRSKPPSTPIRRSAEMSRKPPKSPKGHPIHV